VDQDRFWELVEAAGAVAGGDYQAQATQLAAMLEQLPAEEIIAFERHSVRLLDEADAGTCGVRPTRSAVAAPTTALCTSAAGS
jgi:hypothetical protein